MSEASRPPLREEVTGLVRTRVLDAVGERVRESPWDQVSMAAVAEAAGVSRQTIYNEFDSRDGLALAYVLRETDAFLADVEQAVTAHRDDAHAALRSAVEVFLTAAADHPVLARVARGEVSDTLVALVLASSDNPILGAAADGLAAVLRRLWPAADADAVARLSDAAVRLAVSHAAQPSQPGRPESDAAAVIDVLAPYVDLHVPPAD